MSTAAGMWCDRRRRRRKTAPRGAEVFRRHRAEPALDLELAHRQRQSRKPLMARRHWAHREQRIDRRSADRRQHCERSASVSADSASLLLRDKGVVSCLVISASSSLGSRAGASRNQPSPIASALTLPGRRRSHRDRDHRRPRPGHRPRSRLGRFDDAASFALHDLCGRSRSRRRPRRPVCDCA